MKGQPRIRSINVLAGVIALASGLMAQEAQTAPPSSDAIATLKVETRVVLVDTIVTDKKGNYIRDLTANDFKVWEDGKEQAVTSFSREESNTDPTHAPRHYMVLFFDDTTMEFGDQAKARDAAAKFIAANAGPSHLIAIVEFGGMLRIAQNFTADPERLQKVVAGVKFSTVSPNGPSPDLASLNASQMSQPQALGLPSMGGLEADFGARSVFLALRNLAKGLSGVSGRKSVIMLSAGFPMTIELQSELTSVIDACNKANVAVYPIDVRGLVAPMPTMGSVSHPQKIGQHSARLTPATLKYDGSSHHPLLRLASLVAEPAESPQHGGGGGGTGGGGHGGVGGTGGSGGGHGGGGGRGGGGGTTGGGGSGGGKGGTGGTGGTGGGHGGGGGVGVVGTPYAPNNQPPRQLIPQIPDVSANQQFLYQLADGTGGFVIVNTNNLLGGMDRIAKDQSEYYLLGYKPPESPEGSCHTLKVKINHGGTNVRSRSGYCKARPLDLLAGTTTEKDLESRASGEMPSNVTASMRVPYFYTSPEVARAYLAVDIPSNALQFEKVKGKQHAAVNVLGIAYKPDGAVAARFSDTVNLDFDGKKEQEEFQKRPFHYEKQFEIATGKYTLRIAFSSGNNSFGKLEYPLTVLPFDGKKLSLSSIALSNSVAKVSDLDEALDSEFLEDRKPLVVRGGQISPSATNHFKKTDTGVAYIEIYDPLLAGDKPPQLGVEFRVVDPKTDEKKLDVGMTDTKDLIKPGNPLVPYAVKLPLDKLTPGTYRVDLRAEDSAGNTTNFRVVEFDVE